MNFLSEFSNRDSRSRKIPRPFLRLLPVLVGLGVFVAVFVAQAQTPLPDTYNTPPYAYHIWYWSPLAPTPSVNLWHDSDNWEAFYPSNNFNHLSTVPPDATSATANPGGYAVFLDELSVSATSDAFHTVEVDANVVVKGLYFRGGAWTIQDSDQANSITLTSGRGFVANTYEREAITVDTGSEAAISAKVILGAFPGSTTMSGDPSTSETIRMNAGSKLTLSGDISEATTNYEGNAIASPSKTLIVQAVAGTSPATGSSLTLAGNNSFTGGVTFNSTVATYGVNTTPRLNLNSTHALGTGTLTITGGTAILGNSSGAAVTVANPFVITNAAGTSGNYVAGTGPQPVETENLVFAGANNLTLSANYALPANRAFGVENSGGALILAGQITGAYSLFKNLSGTLGLSVTDNTYTGMTVVNGGTLEVAHLANAGLASSIGDSASTVQKSSSSITINAVSSSGTAATTVTSTTPIPNLILGGGGTLRYVGPGDSTDRLLGMLTGQFNFTDPVTPVAIDASGTGALKFTNTGAIQQINQTGQARNLTLTGTNTDDNTLGLALTDNFNGKRGDNQLTKNGSGTWYVTGNNSYTGGTTVNDGLLVMTGTNTADLPTTNTTSPGTNSAGLATTTVNGGKLLLGNSGTVLPDSGAVVVNGGTFQLGAASETVASLSGTGGTVDLFNGSGHTLTLVGNASGTFSGAIVGSGGSLVKGGTGSLTLSGTNAYTGATTISAGTLQFMKTSAFSNSVIDATTAARLTVASGASAAFNVGGAGKFTSANLDALLGSGGFASGSNVALDTTNASGGTFTAAGNLGGAFSLTKLGSGTLVLGGANTYTGATAINAGKLVVNGSIAGGSLTTINNGGTLGGSGATGAVAIASGGTISPGNSPGTLNTGSQTWNGGGNYAWELDNASDAGAAKGMTYDWLNIAGTLDLAAVTSGSPFTIRIVSLTAGDFSGLAPGFGYGQTYHWTIASATGGISGFSADKFAFDTSAFQAPFDPLAPFTISQAGNDIVLSYAAVPEPSIFGLGIAALLGGAILLRRRSLSRK